MSWTLKTRVVLRVHHQTAEILSDLRHNKVTSYNNNHLIVVVEWTTQLDYGGQVDVIYTDFAKAFDTVPHRRLLSKIVI